MLAVVKTQALFMQAFFMPIINIRYLKTLALLLSLATLCMTHVQADIAMQNPDSRNAIMLDGRWDTIIDPYENGYYNHRYEESENGYFKNAKPANPSDLIEYDFTRSPKLNVPGDWNTQNDQLFLYEGTVWYHRDFDIGKKIDQKYALHFGAVNYHATIYLNGKKIGTHEGGFTPFQFDITGTVKPGLNSLVAKVDNHRERDQIPTVNTDWWNYGGITRSVKVLKYPKAHIQDYVVQLSKTKEGVIEGWVKVATNSKDGVDAQKLEIRIPELNIAQKLSINKNGEVKFEIAANPILWSPESPKLYSVDIQYQQDIVHDKIGFRTIAVQGENILLNGKSVFLRGISIHEESPLHPGRAWSEEDARILLTWAKELGCNFVRLAHYPHSETMVRMADQMGLMVWSEIPVYWTVLFNNPAVYTKAETQLEEMIARDKNRAAIIMWSMANETPNSPARMKFIGQLAEKARDLDSTRLITAALDTHSDDNGFKSIDDPLSAIVDVIGVNSYCGWYSATPSSCANLKWLSRYRKPVIMSEFGADALQGLHGDKAQRWTEEYQADVYINNLMMIDNMSFLRGLSPWILKDFRSPRRPLPNIQDFWNRKGLISDKGIKKKSWVILHDYYVKKAEDFAKKSDEHNNKNLLK
jgi:beta-glucuronidase